MLGLHQLGRQHHCGAEDQRGNKQGRRHLVVTVKRSIDVGNFRQTKPRDVTNGRGLSSARSQERSVVRSLTAEATTLCREGKNTRVLQTEHGLRKHRCIPP